ncbi:MAG: hypothetical protein ACE5F1_22530, partial [Planctomycetota bacterium]
AAVTATTDFSFDVYGRLSSIVDLVSTDPDPVSGFEYVYDKAGNLLKEKYDKQAAGGGGGCPYPCWI